MVIHDWVVERLAALQAAASTTSHSSGPMYLEDWSRVNVVYLEDTVFEDWSSFDAEGRALELDIQVQATDDDDALERAKLIAGEIEASLLEGGGSHTVSGGSVLAERVQESPAATSEETETNYVRLTLEYTFLHRVRRGQPAIIL